MAFIHKVQFCWFMVLVFIILLTLKLDGKINSWNWFIIFIPLWILDSVIAVYTFINMVMHCKNRWWRSGHETSMKKKFICLCGVALKILFQVLLCLRLQYFSELGQVYVMIPFWLFTFGCIAEVFVSLLKLARKPDWMNEYQWMDEYHTWDKD